MRKWTLLLLLTLFPHLVGSGTVASSEAAESPKRINKAIELLERGQPIYYTGGHGGYEEGRKLARTWACLLYTSPSPRDGLLSRMPSSA